MYNFANRMGNRIITNKKVVGLVVLLVLSAGLIIATNLVQRRQTVSNRAAGGNDLILYTEPSRGCAKVGETIDFTFYANTGVDSTVSIDSFSLAGNFDPSKFKVLSFNYLSNFIKLSDSFSGGSFTVSAVNLSEDILSGVVKLVTVRVEVLATGAEVVGSLTSSEIAGLKSGVVANLSIGLRDNPMVLYTLKAAGESCDAVQTPTNTPTVSLIPTNTPANAPTGSGKVTGYVYRDTNENYQKDSGEIGVVGAKVVLEYRSGGPPELKSTISNNVGYYELTGIADGVYYVRVNPPPTGYQPSLYADVEIVGGSTNQRDIGLFVQLSPTNTPAPTLTPKPNEGRVAGYAFVDTNGNKAKDSGEFGVPGAGVSLTGPLTKTVSTNSSGFYNFTDLTSGTYTVKVTAPPAGYSCTVSKTVTLSATGMVQFINLVCTGGSQCHAQGQNCVPDNCCSGLSCLPLSKFDLEEDYVCQPSCQSPAFCYPYNCPDDYVSTAGSCGPDSSCCIPGPNVTPNPTTPPCVLGGKGDLDCDGCIGPTDWTLMAAALGRATSEFGMFGLPAGYKHNPNLSSVGGTSYINIFDAEILRANMKESCPNPPVVTTFQPTAGAATQPPVSQETIVGYVFLDQNRNGVKDTGEQGIAGVEMLLRKSEDLSKNVDLKNTDSGGRYGFKAVAGSYRVYLNKIDSFPNYQILTGYRLYKDVTVGSTGQVSANFPLVNK